MLQQRGTGSGSPAAGLRQETIPGNNPFLLHVPAQSGLQHVKSKVPSPQFLLNHGRDNPRVLLAVENSKDKEETRRAEMSQLNEVVQKLMEEVRKLSCNKQPARGPSTSPEETLPQQQVDDSPNTSAETDQLPSTPTYPKQHYYQMPRRYPHIQ
ncbi:unnamed protein product [Boreogadus saida]